MKFGLIGHPIAHSLSPALFGAGYDRKYPYELIQGEDFETSYQRFLDGYDGINVTAPFKELAFAKADILSDECRLIKATNLLVKTPEGVRAYNSDFLGVRLWLQEVLHEPAKSAVLIVGCGGAGKAAAAAAATLGAGTVLMNRNHERAAALAEDLRAAGYEADAVEINEFCRCFDQADVVIYNVPAAIPQMEELLEEGAVSDRQKHVIEANYKDPSFDDGFLSRLKAFCPNVEYTGGRTWLLYQALTGYEIFTGEMPDLQKMSSVI